MFYTVPLYFRFSGKGWGTNQLKFSLLQGLVEIEISAIFLKIAEFGGELVRRCFLSKAVFDNLRYDIAAGTLQWASSLWKFFAPLIL